MCLDSRRKTTAYEVGYPRSPLTDLISCNSEICCELRDSRYAWIPASRYEEALELVDEIVADRELGVEALSKSVRCGHPSYDLVYAVLARRTASAVLTRDRRLATLLEAMVIPLAGTVKLSRIRGGPRDRGAANR